jgi:cyanophycinase
VIVAPQQVDVAWHQVGGDGAWPQDDNMPVMRRILIVLMLCAPLALQAQGVTVAIGGALRDGNAEVWQRLVTLVQTPMDDAASCYTVVTIASAEPDESAARVAANLARHGGRGVHLRVGPRIAGANTSAALADSRWAQQLRQCRGIYMTGGAQARLLDGLMPHGQPGPLLLAMRDVWREGGVVAGSSAGAAVLSDVVFRDAPEPLAVMKGRLREGEEWSRGFGFAPPGVVVDQHAVRRGRIGRLLPLMQLAGAPLGVAVEEDSAAVFQGDGVLVLGGRGVLIADLSTASPSTPGAFKLQGATLHWLESGDSFQLVKRQLTPSPRKLAGSVLLPLSAQHKGYLPGAWFYADILGDAAIVTAMTRLVDGDQREQRGLAFSAAPAGNDPAPELAFEWRLWLDAATRGWLALEPESYTLTGVRLDIVPVRLQRPLYQPLSTPEPTPPAK